MKWIRGREKKPQSALLCSFQLLQSSLMKSKLTKNRKIAPVHLKVWFNWLEQLYYTWKYSNPPKYRKDFFLFLVSFSVLLLSYFWQHISRKFQVLSSRQPIEIFYMWTKKEQWIARLFLVKITLLYSFLLLFEICFNWKKWH